MIIKCSIFKASFISDAVGFNYDKLQKSIASYQCTDVEQPFTGTIK